MQSQTLMLVQTDAISDKPLQSPQLGISEEEAIVLLQTETDIGVIIDRLYKAGYTPLQIMELFDRIGW